MGQTMVSLKNITKTYPGVKALNDVSLTLEKGEVHALLGENGAGKSTLIKVLAGAINADRGTLEIEGKSYSSMNPRLAKELGLAVVYQEFNLVPTLTVFENILLGDPIKNGIIVDKNKMAEKAKEILDRLKINIDPKMLVRDLSTAHQQIVEIAKAVSRNVKVLIMDEPTASLTNVEIDTLFDIVRNLKSLGVTIVYISHRIEEIFLLSDSVTVMRDGEKIVTLKTTQTNRKELIGHMVGREFTEYYPAKENKPGKTVLEVKNLSGNGIADISFSVKSGEILGVAGLVGSGRTELMQMIFGDRPADSGKIMLNGELVTITSPSSAIKQGIGFIPEDRKRHGVILCLSVLKNISLVHIKKFCKFGIIDRKKENLSAIEYEKRLKIKMTNLDQAVMNLSGGNQQKVVLAKWLLTNSKVLIFDEPTRGIDVAAKQEIYKLMCQLADDGLAIIMVSSDMEELLGMSDRIIVISEGKYAGEVEKLDFNQRHILELAVGN